MAALPRRIRVLGTEGYRAAPGDSGRLQSQRTSVLLLFPDAFCRSAVQSFVREQNIDVVFHYVPLHSSPAGRTFGRTPAPLPVTDRTADRLLRLPLWAGIADEQIDTVIDSVAHALVEVHAK